MHDSRQSNENESLNSHHLSSTIAFAAANNTCKIAYENVGCFSDKESASGRPLPELIMTDRDETSIVYSGKTIGWTNWNTYIDDLACRCAEAAKLKGYTVFGLQDNGKSRRILYIFGCSGSCFANVTATVRAKVRH